MAIGPTRRKHGVGLARANRSFGNVVFWMAIFLLSPVLLAGEPKAAEEPTQASPAAAKPTTEVPPLTAPGVQNREKAAASEKTVKPDDATEKEKAATKARPEAKRPADSPDKSPKPPTFSVAPKARAPLSPSLVALRDRVRSIFAVHFRAPINTNDNTPAQILKFSLAFGCDTEIRYGSAAGGALSGIGALCYNYPCAGYRLLTLDKDKPIARVGYALQDVPGEFLAMLAQSAVPENYELRIGDWRGKVLDLVESEKLSCVAGADLSQKLIGLSHYLPHDATWKNARGDAWSFERMIREELQRVPPTDSSDATNHLLGLAYAIERRARSGQPIDGQFERARKFLDEYHTFALSLQNADGSWNPGFFAAKGPGRDVSGSLRATGRILEWLCVSLPDERLEDRRLVLAVAYVVSVLENYFAPANLIYASPREVDGVMHALHALKLYDQRVFKPAEPPKAQPPNSPKTPETQA